MTDKGLGRRAAPDARDRLYPMRSVLPARLPARTWRYWNADGWWGDQGATPHCVGYAWTHYVEDGPRTWSGPAPIIDPDELYAEAQTVDEWEGEDYDGTSVRAGAKILQEGGWIAEYRWAMSLRDVLDALLHVGPVVVGTVWYESMFTPDEHGLMLVDPASGVAGGHAYVLNGANERRRRARMKNSWGRAWGRRGYAEIAYDDLERLLADDGEACLAIEHA